MASVKSRGLRAEGVHLISQLSSQLVSVFRRPQQPQASIHRFPPTHALEPQTSALPEYRPLDDDDEFRLLDVHAGTFDEPIQCTLRHVRLADKPPYETISYVWGDATDRGSIFIGYRETSVPASSEAALRRMRLGTSDRTLWIDAVCIDQQKTDERTQQVRLMGKIYSNSCGNLIYLGEDENARSAIAAMESVLDDARRRTNDFRDLKNVLYPDGRIHVYSSTAMGEATDVHSMMSILSTPWFNRVWVIQEAALSPKNTCFLGSQSFDLVDVVRALVWIRHHHFYVSSDVRKTNGFLIGAVLYELIHREHGFYYRKGKWTGMAVFNALDLSRRLQTSESKDQVFGVLGLLRRSMSTDPLPSELEPAYQKSDAKVFRDATRYAIYEDGGASLGEVLVQVSHREEGEVVDDSWPSWVPRWFRAWDLAYESGDMAPFFNAGGTSQLPIGNLDDQLDLLELEGLPLDRVSECSIALTLFDANEIRPLQHWLNEIESLISRINDHPSNDAIAAVLTAGRTANGEPVSSEDLASFWSYANMIRDEGRFPPKMRKIQDKHGEKERNASRLEKVFRRACINRKFFTTETGYPGIGPKVMREGDKLVVLYGCQHPYLLRPHGDGQYKILGHCYVHGIMEGEALEKARAEGRESEIFTIC